MDDRLNINERIGKPKLIRKINRDLILKVIRLRKITTQTEIFKLTGLSKQTINKIVTSLMEKKLVLGSGLGESTNEGGKRPLLLKFNAEAYYLAGLLVGENKIRCGVTNLDGKILIEKNIDSHFDKGTEDVIARVIKLLKDTMQSANKSNKFLGIGIGLPGIIDFNEGRVKVLTRHPEWKNIPLRGILQKEFNIPIVIDHEGNVRAVGEKWFGFGREVNNFINIMTTSHGIGAGVVINGEIMRGHNNLCGELGHIVSANAQEKSNLENLLSESSINKMIGGLAKEGYFENSMLLKKIDNSEYIKLEDLFISYNNDDGCAKIVLDKISDYFSVMIISTVCTIDADLIIIHGKFSILKDKFFETVAEKVHGRIFPAMDKEINIKRSIKSKQMGIIGSASMVLDVVPI